MKRFFFLVWTIMSGCAPGVYIDQDPVIDFLSYHQYAWNKLEANTTLNPLYNSDLINEKLTKAIDDQLGKLAFVKTTQSPDFLVDFHIYIEQKNTPDASSGFYRASRYYPNYGFGDWPYSWNQNFRLIPYDDGTLLIDIVDFKTNKLVWRGSAAQAIDVPAQASNTFQKTVSKIMKKFPIRLEKGKRVPSKTIYPTNHLTK
jgi:hypothetical protein